jgi:hypothetical protein
MPQSVVLGAAPPNLKIVEEPYWTPDGTLDFPFSYVYDASALTNGANVQNIAQQLQGDSDFILRRILGVPNIVASASAGGRFNFRNASGTYANGNPSTGIVVPNVWSVVPEKLYRVNDQIAFDLYNILRANTACAEGTLYLSQIAFMGVKRFAKGSTYPRQITPYKYREVRYTYAYQLTINWGHFNAAGVVSPFQRFYQPMDNFDFELLGIRICQPGSSGALTTQDFSITVYDANMHQFSSAPMLQGFYNAARQTPAVCSPYQACFPTPSQVYPAGGSIAFDITANLCLSSLPQSYEIDFDGIWRYPC